MNKAEALKQAKLLFGEMAWVSQYNNTFTVASDPKCRIRVSASSWEEALILAEEKLVAVRKN